MYHCHNLEHEDAGMMRSSRWVERLKARAAKRVLKSKKSRLSNSISKSACQARSLVGPSASRERYCGLMPHAAHSAMPLPECDAAHAAA
jgi:hypothetical protein